MTRGRNLNIEAKKIDSDRDLDWTTAKVTTISTPIDPIQTKLDSPNTDPVHHPDPTDM